MTEYIQLRYHCEPCGIFHSIIDSADEPAGYRTHWTCPACSERYWPSQRCKGKSETPRIGESITHVIKPPAALSLMFSELETGRARLTSRSRRDGWDTRRANAGA